MQKYVLTCLLLCAIGFKSMGQAPKPATPSNIHEDIEKLNFLGSVLYLAAHPDDENTRLISYLSNHLHARTAYLSLTRGDGGQNLIGPELRELLGVLRTQELLAARAIDGGEQYFTRANDFGYSKHPDETFDIWNKDKVLHDVVWVIRNFRPDVIINRFDHRSPGTTHGHHTGSAMLAMEAFDIANNPKHYDNQLKLTTTWQPKRILFNTSWWFYGSREKFAKADKSKLLTANVGVYYPSKGVSNTEIAALSRSQHKCQGFGSAGTRGDQIEYLEFLKGDFPKNNDLFDGIDTSWNRIEGGKQIGAILNPIAKHFNFQNPAAHLPELIKAQGLISKIKDSYWRNQKLKLINKIIKECSGLYLATHADKSQMANKQGITLNTEIIARSGSIPMVLERFEIKNLAIDSTINQEVTTNQKINFKFNKQVKDLPLTSPYWLNEKASLGMYHVPSLALIGKPSSPEALTARYTFSFGNQKIVFDQPVNYKTTDPAIGEVYEPFQIIPEATTTIAEDVYIFNGNLNKKIKVTVRAGKNKLQGQVKLNVPKEWQVSPAYHTVAIAQKDDHQTVEFQLKAPEQQSEGNIEAIFQHHDKAFNQSLIEINYDHIPKQTVLLPAKAKVVKLDIKKKGQLIGYIKGSGDVIPESLEHIGYTVETLDLDALNKNILKKYDAIVVGIRAYNVLEHIDFKQELLFNYVKNGGTMVVQYNTRHRLKTNQLAPFELQLSRDRVTNEYAEVQFLNPTHKVLNAPNKITKADFDGWVQERGLYFPNKWGNEFTPILGMKDKGEKLTKGSLLVAPYGKGYYIYTGLSFFREFPAGVPGAYRLFANLISIGQP